MLEKLGIRMMISVICMWYIMQLKIFKIYVDGYTFLMMLFYALLLSIIIELGYIVLRRWLKLTPIMIIIMLLLGVVIYCRFHIGIYFGMSIYVFVSISIQLIREYHMTRLLDHHLKK